MGQGSKIQETPDFIGDPSRKRTSIEKQWVSSPNPDFPVTEQ
jgi:hypothetical protein